MSKLKYHLIISPIKAAGILSLGLAQRLGKWGGKLAWILGTDASKLLQKTGAAVLVTYAERLPDHRGFRIVVTKAEQDMADKDPTTAATALNQSVENVVRRFPEQYQWEYKRFRHQPGGRPNPYKHSGKN